MAVTGQHIVAGNIIKFGGGFKKHVNKTMELVEKLMDDKISKNISLTDHSLEDLARLGHPYASRRPNAGESRVRSLTGHDPYYQVHKQSGKLLNSKRSGTTKVSISKGGNLKAGAFVMLDERKAKHAAHVVYGTSKMIPRPVLEESRREILKQAMDTIKLNLKDLVFRFNT
jgi:hypothetical protein